MHYLNRFLFSEILYTMPIDESILWLFVKFWGANVLVLVQDGHTSSKVCVRSYIYIQNPCTKAHEVA